MKLKALKILKHLSFISVNFPVVSGGAALLFSGATAAVAVTPAILGGVSANF